MELQKAKEAINEALNIAIKSGCFDLTQTQAIIHALEKINSVQDIEFGEVEPID